MVSLKDTVLKEIQTFLKTVSKSVITSISVQHESNAEIIVYSVNLHWVEELI